MDIDEIRDIELGAMLLRDMVTLGDLDLACLSALLIDHLPAEQQLDLVGCAGRDSAPAISGLVRHLADQDFASGWG